MGCCPSNSLDTLPPLPSIPSQPNTPTSTAPLFPTNQLPADSPPPYSPHPPAGHKSLSPSHSDNQIPVRGWGDQSLFPTPIAAWGPNNNTPNNEYRDRQQLENQVQLLQHFINIIQQESTTHNVPVDQHRGSGDEVESYVMLHNELSEHTDILPSLTEATRRMERIHSPNTLMPIRPISFPHSPNLNSSFPSVLTPSNSMGLNPISSNPLSRLPPLELETLGQEVPGEGAAAAPENQSPHSQRSSVRRKRKKRRRRRATVCPISSLDPHLPSLQRPFTSPNLTATLASPLGSNQAFI